MIIKVEFETGDPEIGSERLWVKVTGVTTDGRFKGKLRNTPALIDLPFGAEVLFSASAIRWEFGTYGWK